MKNTDRQMIAAQREREELGMGVPRAGYKPIEEDHGKDCGCDACLMKWANDPESSANQPISPQSNAPEPPRIPDCKEAQTSADTVTQQLAAIGKALDYGEMFVVMCRDGKWIPDRNISPSVTKFLQIIREVRESFEQYQAGAALSSPSPATEKEK